MKRHLWIAATAVAVLANGAIAQEAGPSDLPVGQAEVSGEPQTYIAATHGDWELRCIRVEEGQPEPCQMYQLLTDQGGSPVAEVNMFDVPDEGAVEAGAQIVTPLETLLTPQLRMQVDDGPVLRYPFTFCQPFGCVVRMGLTAEDIDAFRRGGEATVSIVPLQAPDQTVALTMSLSGFTAAYEDLNARVAAATELLQGE